MFRSIYLLFTKLFGRQIPPPPPPDPGRPESNRTVPSEGRAQSSTKTTRRINTKSPPQSFTHTLHVTDVDSEAGKTFGSVQMEPDKTLTKEKQKGLKQNGELAASSDITHRQTDKSLPLLTVPIDRPTAIQKSTSNSSWFVIDSPNPNSALSWVEAPSPAALFEKPEVTTSNNLIVDIQDALVTQHGMDKLLAIEDYDLVDAYLLILLEMLHESKTELSPHDRGKAFHALRKLSIKASRLPPSLFLQGVECLKREAVAYGGSSDIYLGTYQGNKVALKKMRSLPNSWNAKQLLNNLLREAITWQQLCHPNIHPFLGVEKTVFEYPCTVSPWMANGNIIKCMDDWSHKYPSKTIPLDRWLLEIAKGLAYLHNEAYFAHGDLRGANILVDDSMHIHLADFGLTTAVDATSLDPSGGTAQWMAPELLDPEGYGLSGKPTFASDIYSFACTCIEIYTRQPPFKQLRHGSIPLVVSRGIRPLRPTAKNDKEMSDKLWNFLQLCWSGIISERPLAAKVVEFLSTDY